MNKILYKAFVPNQRVDSLTKNLILLIWLFLIGIYWTFTQSKLIPHPWEVFNALKTLVEVNGFVPELMTSMTLCFKSMFYAIIISAIVAYLSRLAGFSPPMQFIAKARFLTTIGLTFLFALIMPDASSQKTALLVFGTVVFLVTSFLGVMASITKDDLDYARTLKMGEWKTMYYVVILGKASDMFECIRQTFAMTWMMLAMVENICRSEGGIGVILTDQNKHFHMDAVYAIQLVVLLIGIGADFLFGYLKTLLFPYSQLALND